MRFNISVSEVVIVAIVVAGLGVTGWRLFGTGSTGTAQPGSTVVPQLSAAAQAGRIAFDANCAQCHGANGGGTPQGPPLVHDIYNPGHHSDESFSYAARNGVQAHHWAFGNMPPQPQVSDELLAQIVRYVRELQQANGIVYKPHRM
jgi:mono/diheme cytochrome c family protein